MIDYAAMLNQWRRPATGGLLGPQMDGGRPRGLLPYDPVGAIRPLLGSSQPALPGPMPPPMAPATPHYQVRLPFFGGMGGNGGGRSVGRGGGGRVGGGGDRAVQGGLY